MSPHDSPPQRSASGPPGHHSRLHRTLHPTLHRLLALPVAGGLATAAVVALPSLSAPAAASLNVICSGYSGCAAQGYGDGGYGAHNGTMYWNMYSGHNCTNYVAYRMVKAGVGDTRPWSGPGNASYWGDYESKITDQHPTVGSVAWFRRGTSGGSDGHVAYVEKIISPTQIVISEDSWNGDFHWAVLTKDGGTWPSGFIHFIARPTLKTTTPPQVVGTPTVGTPLTLKQGVWTSKGHKHFTQQWMVGGTPVPGATGTTYTPKPADLNESISVKVTVTRPGYDAGQAIAAASAAVTRGDLVNQTPATFTVSGTGTGLVGETLTAVPGTWSPKPAETVFNWKADGHNFPGNFGPTLTLTDALVGKTITVTETAKREGYHRVHHDGTGDVGPVLAGEVTVDTPFQGTSDSGATRLGSTLTMTPGKISPSDATVSYTWTRDGTEVAGADGASYHLTAADFGHEILAHATVSAPDYVPVTRNFSFGRPSTVSHMHIGAKQHRDGAAVRVHVWAAGPGPAPGSVEVTVGDHTVQAPLDDEGVARVDIPHLHPGSRKVEVTYAGSPTIAGSSSKGRLTISKVRASRRIPHSGARDPARAAPAATTPAPSQVGKPANSGKASKSSDKADKSADKSAEKASVSRKGTASGKTTEPEKATTSRKARRHASQQAAHQTAQQAAHQDRGEAKRRTSSRIPKRK